jgi:ferredoxin
MATMIGDTCICCGACETECPNDAISLGDGWNPPPSAHRLRSPSTTSTTL